MTKYIIIEQLVHEDDCDEVCVNHEIFDNLEDVNNKLIEIRSREYKNHDVKLLPYEYLFVYNNYYSNHKWIYTYRCYYRIHSITC